MTRVPSYRSCDPAKPVKTVMPVSSTFDPSHFTNLLIEMT